MEGPADVQLEVEWSDLTRNERGKLEYVLNVKSALASLNRDYEQFSFNAAWNDGVTTHRRINWLDVVRHCFPDVIVVMINDGVSKETQFFEFPGYAIIPRLGRSFDLSKSRIPSGEPGRANQEVTQSLSHLRQRILSIDGSKGENAMKHLRILERMLKTVD